MCLQVKEFITPFLHRVDFTEVDIKAPGNESIFAKYRYEIPVIKIDDKVLHNKQITPSALEEELKEES